MPAPPPLRNARRAPCLVGEMTRALSHHPALLAGVIAAALALTPVLGACGASGLGSFGVPEVAGRGEAEERAAIDALRRNRDVAASYTTLAVVHAGRGELKTARGFAERALALDPASVGALVVAARIAARDGHLELAALHYRDAAGRDPAVARAAAREWSTVLLALAREELEAGRTGAAEATLDELEAALGEHGGRERSERLELYLGVADAWIARGLTERAREVVARARELGADAGESEFALARIEALAAGATDERLTTWANRYDAAGRWPRVARFLADARRPTAAVAAYRRALELRPDDVALWRSFGRTAASARLPDEAVEGFSGAAEREAKLASPALAAWHARLGARALRDDGFREAAIRLYAKAGEVAPADWPTAEEHARYLLAAKEPGAALGVLDAYARAAADGAAVARAAALLQESDARPQAAELLQRAADGPSADTAVFLTLATTLPRGSDEQRDAVRRAEAAATTIPERYDVGRAWLATRDEAGARRVAEELARRAPDDPAAALLLAGVQIARGDRAGGLGAVATLETAVHPPADDIAIARFYASESLWPQAMTALARAVRADAADVRRDALDLAVELAGRNPRALGASFESDARAWLQLVPPDERVAALTRIVALVDRRADLAALRADVLDELTRARPDDPALWLALGEARAQLGDRAAARVAFEQHVAHANHPGPAAEAIGSRYRRDNDNDTAAAFYAMIPPAEVERPEIHLTVGRYLDKLGDQGGAEAHYNALLDASALASGVSGGVVLAFADQLLERGRYELATRAYERLAATPSSPQAVLGLLRVALRQGDEVARQKAEDRYLDGRGVVAANRKRLEDLARVYEGEGFLRLAAERYAQRMSLDASPNIGLFVQIANLYRRLGDGPALEQAATALVGAAPAASPQRFYETAVARLTEAGRDEAAAGLLAQGLERRSRDRRLLLLAFNNALRRGDGEAALDLGVRYAQSERGGATPEAPWLDISKELLGAGEPTLAVRLLDAALADDPGNAVLFALRGRARLAAGDLDGAHGDFIEALSRALSLRDVLDVIEQAYREGLHGDRLLDLQTRVLALAPGRSEHLVALGQSMLAAGKLAEGRQLLERYLAENERGQLAVAEAFRATGYLDLALEHYERAFEQLSADDAKAALDRVAELLAARGEARRLDPFVRLYLVSPRGGTAPITAVGEALLRVGRPTDALTWLERADRETPTPASAEALALVRDALGDHDGARADLLRYVQRQAGERRGRTGLAVNTIETLALERYLASGRFAGALDLAERATASFGDDMGQTFIRARAWLMAGRTAAAMDLALSAPTNLLRAQRDALPVARTLVVALEERGLVPEAIALLDHLLEAGWDRGFALARLRLVARAGRLADAEREALAIVAESGRTSEAAVGKALAVEGVPGLAAPHLWEALAVAQGPAVASVALRLLRVEQRLGRAPEAVIPKIVAGARLAREDLRERGLVEARLWFAAGDAKRASAALAPLIAAASPGDDLWPMTASVAAAAHDPAPLVALTKKLGGQPGVRDRVGAWLAQADPVVGLGVLDVLLASDGANVKLWLAGLRLALDAGDAARQQRCEAAIRQHLGDRPAAHLALARVFVDHLAADRAARELAAITEPSDPERNEIAWLELRMALAAGDAQAVGARATAFVETSPDEPTARVLAAREVLGGGGSPALALELLDRPLREETPAREALELAVRAAYRAGDRAAARAHLARLRAAYPTSTQLGELLVAAVEAGDVESVGPLVAAMQVDPRFGARHVAAALTRALGPSSSATVRDAVAGELERVTPALPVCDLTLVGAWAALAEARGDRPAGARAYEEALVACPQSAGLANNLAWYLLDGRVDVAHTLSLARDTLTREQAPGLFDPDADADALPSSNALDTWAWALHASGRDAEALAAVDRALATFGGEEDGAGEAIYHRAVILDALGRGGEARAAYRAAARREPTAAWGREAKAKLGAPPAAAP